MQSHTTKKESWVCGRAKERERNWATNARKRERNILNGTVRKMRPDSFTQLSLFVSVITSELNEVLYFFFNHYLKTKGGGALNALTVFFVH